MTPFDFFPRTRIVFGVDCVDTLGDRAGEMGVRRALVVSDPGIVAAGHTERGVESLRKAGITTVVFDEVQENPTTEDVVRGVAVAKRLEPELLVGLGGGSSMDCAKGINFIYSNGGRMADYWGVGKALREMLPMIAIPTTAGTGSETQSFALISDAETHVKMACGDKKASCRIAMLDPGLTLTQPPRVTALTGIDAVAHALETFVTTKRNPASMAFSRESWRLLSTNFSQVLQTPSDIEARGAMQLGACFAGLAIENSMLGATHALANPLTSRFGIVHGQAIGLMLPHVIRFNAEVCADSYSVLADLVGVATSDSARENAERLAVFVEDLVRQAGLPQQLRQCSVTEDTLGTLAEESAKQWTGTFNPRQVDATSLLRLYERAR
ncbi:MAG: iron-containing alcohol dehydrogenase [Planctomycetales bacterium]|nr:iron-containing alcohol dehydrogenase [Planctomycetales bacterium]